MEIGNQNDEEMGENGEEEGGENNEQENEEGEEEEHIGYEPNNDEQVQAHYNIEEYLPYEHKHDQYSCTCCEHYYIEAIKNDSKLPEYKCEVCGNLINRSSLKFYKAKYGNKK